MVAMTARRIVVTSEWRSSLSLQYSLHMIVALPLLSQSSPLHSTVCICSCAALGGSGPMWQHLNVAVATSYWQHATTSLRGFLEGNNTPTAADSCNRTMMALIPLAVETATGSGGIAAIVLMRHWTFNSSASRSWPLFVCILWLHNNLPFVLYSRSFL
jgi:hypothetical protein